MKPRQGKPKRIKIVPLPPRKPRKRIPVLSSLWDRVLAIAASVGRYSVVLLPLTWFILILVIFWSVKQILSLGQPQPIVWTDLYKVEQGRLLEAIGAIVIGCVGFSLIIRPTLKHNQRYGLARSSSQRVALLRSRSVAKKLSLPTNEGAATAIAPENPNRPS
ncbi:MAG: hypothetical protein VKJ24_04395 [Synechococcales bacterium]|nr:hypothetical protein [Synechococcales bacterium]